MAATITITSFDSISICLTGCARRLFFSYIRDLETELRADRFDFDDRLKVARRCAMQVGRPMFRAKSEQEQDEAIQNLDEHAREVHGKFMQLAFDLVDGTHDSSTYEDACRSLLGNYTHVTAAAICFPPTFCSYHAISPLNALQVQIHTRFSHWTS